MPFGKISLADLINKSPELKKDLRELNHVEIKSQHGVYLLTAAKLNSGFTYFGMGTSEDILLYAFEGVIER